MSEWGGEDSRKKLRKFSASAVWMELPLKWEKKNTEDWEPKRQH